jgi:hypothetical protein
MPIIDLDPPPMDADADAEAPTRPRDPLFKVEGKVYTIVRSFTAAECLRALEIMVSVSYSASLIYLMKTALGEDGWQALKNAESMTPEQYTQIVDIIKAKSVATSKLMAGNSNGS